MSFLLKIPAVRQKSALAHFKRKNALLPFFLLVLISCSKSPAVPAKEARVESASETVDQVILKSGGMIEGEIVEQTPAGILFRWGGGTVRFEQSEISEVHRGVSRAGGSGPESIFLPEQTSFYEVVRMWPKGAKRLVFLKNAEWIGGGIVAKNDRALTVRKNLEGGGVVELDIDLDRIEKIEMWPFPNEPAAKHLAGLRTFFPDLAPLEFGHYHILAGDQSSPEFKRFLRALNQVYYDWILYFFPLLGNVSSLEPLDVLVLRSKSEFNRVLKEGGDISAAKDTVVSYQMKDRKLVFYNAKSESGVEKRLEEARAIRERARHARRKEGASARQPAGGQARLEKSKRPAEKMELEEADVQTQELNILGRTYLHMLRAVRHEGARQLFDALGILPADVYAGGWLVEGLGIFCETDPIGAIHEDELMYLRFQLEQGGLLPLSHLLGLGRKEAFRQLDPSYVNLAYAESWAFVSFLLNGEYSKNFLSFIGKIRFQDERYGAEEERRLLEQALGKRLSEIETDFILAAKELVRKNTDAKRYEEFKNRLRQSF